MRLARVGEEHAVLVRALRLQHLDRVVALRDAVRAVGRLGAVERVDFLPQHRPAQRAAGFPHFLAGKVVGERLPSGSRMVVGRIVSSSSIASSCAAVSPAMASLESPSA